MPRSGLVFAALLAVLVPLAGWHFCDSLAAPFIGFAPVLVIMVVRNIILQKMWGRLSVRQRVEVDAKFLVAVLWHRRLTRLYRDTFGATDRLARAEKGFGIAFAGALIGWAVTYVMSFGLLPCE